MRLTRVTPPAVVPVELEELKEHLGITFDQDDLLLEDLIDVATAELDGRKGKLGRCLIAQQWRMTIEGFSRRIVLPFPNILSVDSIGYTDAAGPHTLAPEAYTVTGLGDDEPAVIDPRASAWPRATSVAVLFTAGYGEEAADVPAQLRHWIKMRVGALYEHRESVASGSDAVRVTPGFDDLLAEHTVWSC